VSLLCLPLLHAIGSLALPIAMMGPGWAWGMHAWVSPQRLKQKALRPNLLWSARKSFRYLFLSQQGPATAMAVSSPFTHSTSRALLSLVLYCQGRLERRYASILIGKTLPWGDCCSAESSLWFGLHASIKRL